MLLLTLLLRCYLICCTRLLLIPAAWLIYVGSSGRYPLRYVALHVGAVAVTRLRYAFPLLAVRVLITVADSTFVVGGYDSRLHVCYPALLAGCYGLLVQLVGLFPHVDHPVYRFPLPTFPSSRILPRQFPPPGHTRLTAYATYTYQFHTGYQHTTRTRAYMLLVCSTPLVGSHYAYRVHATFIPMVGYNYCRTALPVTARVLPRCALGLLAADTVTTG